MYECEYCGNVLCPEVCVEGKRATQEWVESEDYYKLLEDNPIEVVL